ncbi:acyltransferase family protein [Roseibacillus persicicus]|uniref:acyltransferase family protein n=1 Tax=Roseibacillus persicicus TaxID=454148 RepID=UPI00167438BE|nr:acyltransferase [Roseibacillus persicicus]
MFGIYRTFLALWVALFHLTSVGGIGSMAVFSFYLLSGFLMTLIMVEKYGYTREGRVNFARNRFLRLFPVYWCCIVISAIIIWFAGSEAATDFRANLGFPSGVRSWIGNVTMFYPSVMPGMVNPRLCPPSWALTVELVWYTLIAFGLSKTKTRVMIWLGAAVCGQLLIPFLNLGWGALYFSIAAGSLPFALGAACYHWREYIGERTKIRYIGGGGLLWCGILTGAAIVAAVLEYLGHNFKVVFLYLTVVLAAPATVALYYQRPSSGWRKWDKVIGRYSYLIYLLHIPLGLMTERALVSQEWYRSLPIPFAGFIVFGVSLIPLFLLSAIIIKLVEIPLEGAKVAPRGNFRN